MHFQMFGSILCLFPLDASSTPTSSSDNKKIPPGIAKSPGGEGEAKLPAVENHLVVCIS